MYIRLMLMVFLMSFALVPLAFAGVRATFFYNGTIVFYFNSRSWIEIPQNATLVTPSNQVISSGQLVSPLEVPGTLTFTTSTRGVINLDEPNVTETFVLLPVDSRITYVSPVPTSVQENGYVNLTFSSGNVTVLYYLVPDQGGIILNPYFYTTAVSSAASAYMAYLLWRRRPAPEVAPANQLDERDAKILEAIRAGADNLNKISEAALLPRTTVYRRIKRLVNMGLVEEKRERGKVRYVVREK